MKKSKAKYDVAEILTKIQDQLVLLDRKIDILFSKASTRPSEAPEPQRPVQNQRPERQYYHAICADCRKPCEVPFRPTGDRPVYCKACFAKRKNNNMPMKPAFEKRPVVAEKKPAVVVSKIAAKKKPAGKRKKGLSMK